MKDTHGLTNPLARKEGLIVQELPDEVLVYDLEADRAHCLNETAAFVWQHCDGRKTAGEIAKLLGKKASAKVDERIVWLALDQLGDSKLLARRPAAPAPLAGVDRRQVMRAIGLAAIVAVPVVTSIVAPMPAQAVSCAHTSQSCATLTCCQGCVCDPQTSLCTGSC